MISPQSQTLSPETSITLSCAATRCRGIYDVYFKTILGQPIGHDIIVPNPGNTDNPCLTTTVNDSILCSTELCTYSFKVNYTTNTEIRELLEQLLQCVVAYNDSTLCSEYIISIQFTGEFTLHVLFNLRLSTALYVYPTQIEIVQ